MHTLPQNLQNDINQKGFVVYHYISFWELMQTVKRNYLSVLGTINIPFAIASVLFGYFAFESQNFSLLLGFFLLSYGIIFSILFAKLIARTRDYFHISNVIFTHKGIVLGEEIIEYQDIKTRKKILESYEKKFDEYLAKPSKISEVITAKEKKLFEGTKKIFSSGMKMGEKFSDNQDIRIQAFIFIALAIYSIFLFIFYYLGVFVGYFFFGIYAVFIKIMLFFSQKIELQIKFSAEGLEKKISALLSTEEKISQKIKNFSDGEISDIAPFIEKKFTIFYQLIEKILLEQEHLKKIIQNSAYKNFIDFQKFSGYIKDQYNKPVSNMLILLKTQLKNNTLEQKKFSTLDKNSPEFSAHLTQKFLRLQQMEKIFVGNIEKLEAMKI